MSRPSSVGSYLQVKWWAFSQWKGDCARWREAHHFFETGNEWSASHQGEKETRGWRASLLAQFTLSLSFTRALYTCRLKETAEFLDRCSVGKKRRKKLWRILPLLSRPYQITFHDFRELCQVIKQSCFVTFPITNESRWFNKLELLLTIIYRVFRISQSELTKSIDDSNFNDGTVWFNS